jgi:hypothetical protein
MGIQRIATSLVVCGGIALAFYPADAHAGTAWTPDVKAEAPATAPAAPPKAGELPQVSIKVTYNDGQLAIKALNFTLGEVLTKVSSLVGMKLDVPPGVNGERLPFVEVGPGPAREVLAELLSETKFDYLIQASETNPEKIENLLLMMRDGKSSKPSDTMARSQCPAYSRPSPQPVPEPEEKLPAPENAAVAAPAGNGVVTAPAVSAASTDAPPADATTSDLPPAPIAGADLVLPPSLQPAQTSQPRPGALAPPESLTPQSMSQQLQQMYQQRVQINQQERQAGQSGPTNSPK